MKKLLVSAVVLFTTMFFTSCEREPIPAAAIGPTAYDHLVSCGGRWRITAIGTDLNSNGFIDAGEPVEDPVFYDDIMSFRPDPAAPPGGLPSVRFMLSDYNTYDVRPNRYYTSSWNASPAPHGKITFGDLAAPANFMEWQILAIDGINMRVRSTETAPGSLPTTRIITLIKT